MGHRLDVRRMLIARGWTEEGRVLRKGTALWVPFNDAGDSGLQAGGPKRYSIEFNNDVPARIITAVAEAAAKED